MPFDIEDFGGNQGGPWPLQLISPLQLYKIRSVFIREGLEEFFGEYLISSRGFISDIDDLPVERIRQMEHDSHKKTYANIDQIDSYGQYEKNVNSLDILNNFVITCGLNLLSDTEVEGIINDFSNDYPDCIEEIIENVYQDKYSEHIAADIIDFPKALFLPQIKARYTALSEVLHGVDKRINWPDSEVFEKLCGEIEAILYPNVNRSDGRERGAP